MNKYSFVICILFAIIFTGKIEVSGQVPSRDNFNFIFENNFEDDQLGRYLQSDYFKDWNLGAASALASHEIIDIIADSDSKYNKVMRAYFAKGTVGPGEHGAYWEVPIPGCTEIYFSYDIRFKPGFEWVIGGKIPGVFGGKTAAGKMPGPTDGFSTRAMWKENGRPVAYVYHQNQTTLYGNSYYWGNFAFTSGKWYNVTIRVVLNTVGKANGIYEGYIDGKLMFQKKDFEYRGVESVKIEKMNISMFFGGSTPDWAPIRDEWIDTDNFVAYTYSSKATNVPKGIQAASSGWTLVHPYYNFGSTSTVSVPAAPTSLSSTSVSSNSVSLKWTDNCTNEQGFKIECRRDDETSFSQIATAGANSVSYTHSGLQSGKSYYYRVRAYNTAGNSGYSNTLNVSTTSGTSSGGGLIAKYNYENSVADVSGNGYNGSLVNGPTYSTARFKEGTRSLLFDGSNDYVNLGTINLGNQFTFASWVYIPSGSSNIKTIIANAGSGSTTNGFKIMVNTYNTADGMIRVETGNGSQSGTTNSAAGAFKFDQWNHIAVTLDQTNRDAKIYLNGTEVTIAKSVAANFNVNAATRLGIMTSTNYPLKGHLDDTRIYGKVLSAAEISSLIATAPTPTIPAAPGSLVATIDGSSVKLSWKDNANNESGYKLERSLTSGSGYSVIHTGPVNCTSYSDASVSQGTTYYYRVRAYNQAGESANCTPVSVSVPVSEPGGLVARYIYEGSVSDVTGSGHNGTMVNGPVFSTAKVKEGTRSILLDGSNDYVDVGTFNLGNQFTFATWVFIPSGASNIRTIIANTASGSNSNGFKIMVNSYGTTDRSIRVETGNGTSSGITASNTNKFEFDRWNHIAVTIDRTNGKARIYYNGVDVTTTSVVASNFSNNANTRLGIMTNGNFPMKGHLDDTRIYNRLLTAAEISSLTELPYLKSGEEIATGVAITMESQDAPVVFPNPFNEYFTVRAAEPIKAIEIYNLSGVKVFQDQDIESREYIINNLNDQNSVYIVKVLLSNGKTQIIKVLKQK